MTTLGITLTPSHIHSILERYNVTPDYTFIAAAGKEFGYVAAWDLLGQYLIQIVESQEIDYTFADDVDDLASWLELPDYPSHEFLVEKANACGMTIEHVRRICAVDMLVLKANVRGIDYFGPADEDANAPFYVLRTRYWEDQTETTESIKNKNGEPIEFGTYKDAQVWIDNACNNIYTLSQNEITVPSYKIVSGSILLCRR